MKKSGGRSYLQQLAQPVLPGATVLTARPISAAYANESGPQVPVIEDRFNFPVNELTPPARDSARRPMNRTPSAIESSIDPAAGPVNADPLATESQRPAARHFDLPGPSAEPGTVIHSVQHFDARSAATSNPQGRDVHDERSIENPTPPETHNAVADRLEPEIPRVVQPPPHEDSNAERPFGRTERQTIASAAREFVQEPIAAKDAPSSQFMPHEDSTKRRDIPQASDGFAPIPAQPAAKERTEKPEARTSDGPRVHIGTLEIRAVLPQPVAPQPVAMAQNVVQNNVAAQARGRSGAAEPLARGLDWSYGLVQG